MKVFQMIAMLLIVSILSCKKDSSTGANPKVVSTNPAGNVTGVPRNNAIAFTFSEPMDSSTINDSTFTLYQGSTVVPGTVSYSGTTAVFTPTTILAAGTPYTATELPVRKTRLALVWQQTLFGILPPEAAHPHLQWLIWV